MTGGLHDGRARRGIPSHEQRDADDAFVADAGRFRRGAGRHDVVQRDDGRRREIGILQLAAGFVEHLAEEERCEFQMRCQGLEFSRRQCRQKVILAAGRCCQLG